MNSSLKNREVDIPQNILDKINHTLVGLQGKHVAGVNRARKLLSDKKIKYGKVKRIIHDLENMDTNVNRVKYDLAGGDLMRSWFKQFWGGEKDLIANRKESKKRADEIGGLTGERKNSYLKKHTKKQSLLPPVNLIKSNSHKSSITPLTSLKLFEEINKIKKLM